MKKGYSQAQVAQKINKNKTVISRYENNQLTPTLDTLIEFANLYNVSLDYLVGLEKHSILVDDLSENQITLLSALLAEFRQPSHTVASGLTPKQLQILNLLIAEFVRK